MEKYKTFKKRIWIPVIIIIVIISIIVFIIYKDFYLSATILIIPLFFLPTISRSKRRDPDLIIIDSLLIIRGMPINKEFDLKEYYEFKIEKSILNIENIYGYKMVDEVKKRDLLVRPIYQDPLVKILTKLYSKTL